MYFFLFFIYLIVSSIVLIYWTVILLSFPRNRVLKFKENSKLSVSVIICAKNEAQNIKKCLDSILTQDYPDFNIIVVNDYSTDDTEQILAAYQERFSNCSFFTPSRDVPGKKLGITEAIASTQQDLILLTDADCVASSDHWISAMVQALTTDRDIVLGYGPLHKNATCLATFSRYETLVTAIQYFAYARLGMPYMGVGRNLLFRKSVFTDNKGYSSHIDQSSGDDDLFIQEVARGENTAWCLDQRAYMYSTAAVSLTDYIAQKKRHLNTSTQYQWHHKMLLSALPFSLILMYLTGLVLLFTSWAMYILGFYLLRILILMILFIRPSRSLSSEDLVYKYPLLEVIHIIYLIYFAPTAFNSNKHDWNG